MGLDLDGRLERDLGNEQMIVELLANDERLVGLALGRRGESGDDGPADSIARGSCAVVGFPSAFDAACRCDPFGAAVVRRDRGSVPPATGSLAFR